MHRLQGYTDQVSGMPTERGRQPMAAAYVLCQMSPQSESPWVGAKSSKHAGEATCREPFCARKLTMRWSALPVGRGTRWHALMMDT